jgi:hypothetical protein
VSEYTYAEASLIQAVNADNQRLRAENERLREALTFYADKKRYRGANQRLNGPDKFTENAGLTAYLLDVTRDDGLIARNALDAE